MTLKKSRKDLNDFTEEELEFIKNRTKRAPIGERMTARQLAQLPEMSRHTVDSIKTRIKKHSWADVERSSPLKFAKRFKKAEKFRVMKLLKNEWRFWPASIIARNLGCSQNQITHFRRMIKKQLVHSDEAMLDPVYKKWYTEKEAHRVKRLKECFAERPANRQQELDEKMKVALKRRATFGSMRECRICHKSRPKTSDFFRTITRFAASGERYRVLTKICIACNRPHYRKK